MKVLIGFSIPSIKVFKNVGDTIKKGEIPAKTLKGLIKTGHVAKK